MSGFVDSQENAVLDALFGASALSVPGTWYVGLLTALPSDDGTGGTEVAGGSYARVAVLNTVGNFPAAAGGQKSNGAAIVFPTASGSWGTIVGVGLWDTASGGTPRLFGLLDASRAVITGDDFRFQVGTLALEFID